MSYCINPSCPNFNDPSNVNERNCADCGPERLLQGRYRVIQPLGRGSFGQTFEVDDVLGVTSKVGTRKVLKILLTNYPRAVSLFQREARILTLLKHPGIPKVEPDGYFTFWLQDSQQPLHCLVMEKIEGINLKEWLRNQNNQPITPQQAIAWLKQLAEILVQIHLKQYLHRDIKPSNIMLQPNGRLVLIDFGGVREAAKTYLQKLEGRGGTVIISPGYTPPEQANGRPVLKSDFYALGRTFVHLLTGKHPLDLSKHPETGEVGELVWTSSAPQVSQVLADLIDHLMAPLSKNRPENAQEILHRLNEIERSMLTPKQMQMYAIRLKPGYLPSMAAGEYVAYSALPSEIRFTPEIQTARTWGSYQEAYSYLDENLYGMAKVVTVVSMHRLLADINSLGDGAIGLSQGTTSNLESSSSPKSDYKLYLYRLYHKSEFPSPSGEPLAEEWATVAEMLEVNQELSKHGFIWVKAQN